VQEPGPETIRTPPRPVSPTPESGADRAILLGAARNALKQGNYDVAIARFEEYLRRFGDDPAIRREYAGVLFSANRLRKAMEQYERLLTAEPNNLRLLALLGDIQVASKEYRKAIVLFTRALGRAPDNLEIATRLARAHALDDDMPHALEVYDRHLAQLHPGDANVPRGFGGLLIDLEQPADALPFLLATLEKHAEDAEILADLVRCHARLGDQQKATLALQDLAAKAPHALPVRQTLGDTLYQSGDYELAGQVYEQILQLDPGNGFAVVGKARVALQFYQPAEARRLLEGLKPGESVRRIYLLTWAEYHQLVGEYVEARQIYADFLARDGDDYEVRLALAALDDYIHEYEKAKAEYAKIPAGAALGRQARLGFAAALADQRFFAEAAAACKTLLAERPADGSALALLVHCLDKTDQFDQAAALCRALLENNPRNEPAVLSVRFALGKVLLDAGKYLEAVHEYEWLLGRPGGRVAAAGYGVVRALEKLGDHDHAQRALAAALALPGGEVRNRLLLADLYAGDNDDQRTVEMCQAVLACDPQNLAALIRLADAQQRLARFSAHSEEAVHTCQAILALSPTNVRGHLALARSLASVARFRDAAGEYDRLLAVDPSFTVPQREKARVLFSAHAFTESAAAYQHMQVPSADDKLQADLAALAEKEPRLRPTVDLLLRANLPGKLLRAEVGKLAASATETAVQSALQHLLADYDARTAEQAGAFLEGDAKSKKDIRNYEAVPAYKALLAAEPGNEEGLFDLGQVYGGLRQTRAEVDQYGQLLKVEPLDREGLVALERASLEMQPRFGLNAEFLDEHGRGGLAAIGALRYAGWGSVPLGDEDEFFLLGFSRARLTPRDDRLVDGNIVSARIQYKCSEPLLLWAQLNYEDWSALLHDHFTFDAGARYDFCDLVHGWARTFLEDVLQNGESLRQNITRTGLDLGADVFPTRIWSLGGWSQAAYYSDVNYMGELYLYNNVLLTLPPKQLKFVLDADLQTFAHSTVFGPIPDDLHGIQFPYFSPRGFAYYEARIEWTQWLSRDYFTHSNQCYYSLQYANGFDSNLVNYNTFRALLNLDVRPWLTIGADGKVILSRDYNAAAAVAFLVIRFPCCYFRK
jgi:tetratricopeptide (TPR) repeat protein